MLADVTMTDRLIPCRDCGEPVAVGTANGGYMLERWCACERNAAVRLWPRWSVAFIRLLREIGRLRHG